MIWRVGDLFFALLLLGLWLLAHFHSAFPTLLLSALQKKLYLWQTVSVTLLPFNSNPRAPVERHKNQKSWIPWNSGAGFHKHSTAWLTLGGSSAESMNFEPETDSGDSLQVSALGNSLQLRAVSRSIFENCVVVQVLSCCRWHHLIPNPSSALLDCWEAPPAVEKTNCGSTSDFLLLGLVCDSWSPLLLS